MSLLDRQRAIRSADAALREADLPLYADVVVALHRLQAAVEKLHDPNSRKPISPQLKCVLHYATDAKELVECFQHSPVDYERMRKQAEIELRRALAFAKHQPPASSEPDDPFDF